MVAAGYDAELDETRRLRDEGRGVIAELQGEYVRRSGIAALKIRHNNVLGYYIETPATHAEKMLAPPLAELFVHRQTTANAVRFTTLALAEIEKRILERRRAGAGDRAADVRRRCARRCWREAGPLGAAARGLAEIDLAGGARRSRAWRRTGCAPEVDDEPRLRRAAAAGTRWSRRRCAARARTFVAERLRGRRGRRRTRGRCG